MKLDRATLLSFVLALVSILFVANEPGLANPCLDITQPHSFRFKGVLTHKVFPGPPNYQDVRKGDKPESAYILQLAKPICVSGDEFVDPNAQIERIQIFPQYADTKDEALWRALRNLVGRSVVVEGKEPFGAQTGHHHAPLLLPITAIMQGK